MASVVVDAVVAGMGRIRDMARLHGRLAIGPDGDEPFPTRDIIYDGVLSEEFMREWLFSFNLASNEVWVRRARRTHGTIGTLEGR